MRSKKKYLIDGRFLNSMTTGIDRYAYQLLACLDKICKGSDIAILVPANAKEIPAYKNIRDRFRRVLFRSKFLRIKISV